MDSIYDIALGNELHKVIVGSPHNIEVQGIYVFPGIRSRKRGICNNFKCIRVFGRDGIALIVHPRREMVTEILRGGNRQYCTLVK